MFAHDLPSGPHEIELSINPGIEPQSAFSNSASIDHPSQSNIILMNPFLDGSFHAWSKLTPERVVPDMTLALEKAESDMQTIRSLGRKKLISGTPPCGSAKLRRFGEAWNLVSHLDQVVIRRNCGSLQRNAPQSNRLWNQGSARPNPLETSQVLLNRKKRNPSKVRKRGCSTNWWRISWKRLPISRRQRTTRGTVHRTCPGYPKVLRERA